MGEAVGESIHGVVIRIDAGACLVDTTIGTLRCTARKRLRRGRTALKRLLAVGDRVQVSPTGPDSGVIGRIGERRSKLSRRAAGPRAREQVIAANVDQLLAVTSFAVPPPNFEVVDRALVAAAAGGLAAVICATKLDLRPNAEAHAPELAVYRDMGYPVVETSIANGAGLEALRTQLRDQTTVVAGMSGVGKSSLLNALEPGLRLRTGPVSTKSGEGTHTTTASSLLKLKGGGYVVDTPGIRDYTLWDIHPAALAQLMPDLERHADACRFTNCVHDHEPDCALKAACKAGLISPRRYTSYITMLHTFQAGGAH